MVIIFLVFHKLGPYKNSLQIVTIEWHAYVDFVGGAGRCNIFLKVKILLLSFHVVCKLQSLRQMLVA